MTAEHPTKLGVPLSPRHVCVGRPRGRVRERAVGSQGPASEQSLGTGRGGAGGALGCCRRKSSLRSASHRAPSPPSHRHTHAHSTQAWPGSQLVAGRKRPAWEVAFQGRTEVKGLPGDLQRSCWRQSLARPLVCCAHKALQSTSCFSQALAFCLPNRDRVRPGLEGLGADLEPCSSGASEGYEVCPRARPT